MSDQAVSVNDKDEDETTLNEQLHPDEHKEAKRKYNDLHVRFNEINEDLDYTQLVFSDNRDYEEIKLRNKKLENDLIHSNERHLSELSKVRENFENQMKNRTSVLQSEINELRQTQEQTDIEYNQQINELEDVIETERSLQKNRFKDIISHFENILARTKIFNEQLETDFVSLKTRTTSLKNQTINLEFDLKREFSDNLDILRQTIPFASEQSKKNLELHSDEIPSRDSDATTIKGILKQNSN